MWGVQRFIGSLGLGFTRSFQASRIPKLALPLKLQLPGNYLLKKRTIYGVSYIYIYMVYICIYISIYISLSLSLSSTVPYVLYIQSHKRTKEAAQRTPGWSPGSEA